MEAAAAEPSGLDPLPDDLMPDAAWVRARGWSPLEFLVYAYRNPWLKISDRISAARATLDYAHRKLPQTVQVTGADGAPVVLRAAGVALTPENLAKLSDAELDTFRAVLEKLGGVA